MNKGLLIIFFCLLVFGCQKDQEPSSREGSQLPSYIKNILPPDTSNPYEGSYYIYVTFTNHTTAETRKLHLDDNNSSMAFKYDSSDKKEGLSEQTIMFISNAFGEHLEISFYYDLAIDTTFKLCCADYLYGDAWKGIAGANIQYSRPAEQGSGGINYIYRGTNDNQSYFNITYLGDSSINGIFHTTWEECCGEQTTYDVTGDFSIPVFRYYRRQ